MTPGEKQLVSAALSVRAASFEAYTALVSALRVLAEEATTKSVTPATDNSVFFLNGNALAYREAHRIVSCAPQLHEQTAKRTP